MTADLAHTVRNHDCRLLALAEDLHICIDPIHWRALLVMCSSLANSLAQLLAPPKLSGRVVSIYLVAFLGGSPLGSLVSGWLVTRLGSAPMMLVVNSTALTLVALYFLIRGPGLEDI
jgi:Transmembrane secretion effector